MKVKIKRNMIGGKYIAEGSYGCIYRPSIPGSKYPRNQNLVSKIVDRDNLEHEYSNIAELKLDKLDPTNKYFIFPKAVDVIKDIDEINDDLLEDCELIDPDYLPLTNSDVDIQNSLTKLNKKYVNLIIDNGGESLDNLRDYNKNEHISTKLMDYLNLLKGVLLLKSNGILHRDIKPANITTEPIMKLIDFGLTTNIFDFNDKTHTTFSGTDYVFWPLDYQMLLPNFEKNVKRIQAINNKPQKIAESIKLVHDMFEKNYGANFTNKLLTTEDQKNMFIQCVQFFIDLVLKDKYDINEARQKCFESIDVYSLGIVLNSEIISLGENGDINEKQVVETLKELVSKMIAGNPFERIDILEACVELVNIMYDIDILDEYGLQTEMDIIGEIAGVELETSDN